MGALGRQARKGLLGLLLAGAAPAQPVRSESPAPKEDWVRDIEQLDLATLLGTVMSVSRHQESRVRSPASVTVLEHSDISQTGATSLPELIRRVPGVQTYRVAGGNEVVSLRGTNGLVGNNLVVLLDGVPLNNPVDATLDWGAIPLAIQDIERIELVRGPVSTIYGANAYTGVLSISSRRADGWTARVGAGADLSGSPGALASGTLGRADQWAAMLDGAWDARLARSQAKDGTVSQPPLRKASGWLTGRWQLGPDLELTASGGGGVDDRSATDYLALDAQAQSQRRALATAKLNRRNLGAHLSELSGWWRAGWLSTQADSTVYSGFSYAEVRSLDSELGLDLRAPLLEPWVLGGGVSGGMARVSAPFLHPAENARTRLRYGGYLTLDADLFEQRLAVSAAARLDVSDTTRGLNFSYRASATYHQGSTAVRLSAGSAFRQLSYVEAGGQFKDPNTGLILLEGDASLLPPRVESVELGLLWAASERLQLTPTLYLQRLSRLVAQDFRSLVRKTFVNEADPRTALGGELEARYQLTASATVKASAAAMQWLDAPAESRSSIGVPSQSSALTAWLGISEQWWEGRLQLSAACGLLTGRQYVLRTGIPTRAVNQEVPAQLLGDLFASWRPSPRYPFQVWLKASSSLPQPVNESPFSNAASTGTSMMAGIQWGSAEPHGTP